MTEEDFMWQLQQMEEQEEEEQVSQEEQKPQVQTQTRVEVVPEVVPEVEPEAEPVVVVEEKKIQVLDEEITTRFYDLLRERNISPFSVYSMEYPHLQTDPRFTCKCSTVINLHLIYCYVVVPHNKQKTLFNKYCNGLSEKIKNEKKNKKVKHV
jgi:transcription elongation regulator 1